MDDKTPIEGPVNSLIKNRLLRNETEMTNFLQSIDDLKLISATILLPNLFEAFVDEAENTAPLEVLISFIRSLDKNVFIENLIKATPMMEKKAFNWLKVLYLGALANLESRTILKDCLTKVSNKEHQIVHNILQAIALSDYDDIEVQESIKKDINFILN